MRIAESYSSTTGSCVLATMGEPLYADVLARPTQKTLHPLKLAAHCIKVSVTCGIRPVWWHCTCIDLYRTPNAGSHSALQYESRPTPDSLCMPLSSSTGDSS